MKTELGEACLSPLTIEVVEIAEDRWMVRSRYIGFPPTNHDTFATAAEANEFAQDLNDITRDMTIKLFGFPAKLELAEVTDDT